MLPWILLFIVLPAVELVLLIQIGSRIGALVTVALIIGTGALGAALARRQGLEVVRRIEREMGQGMMPGAALLHGAVLLVAAALLVTPGVLTDGFGFLCLVPAFRRRAVEWLARWLADRVQRGTMTFDVRFAGRWESPSGPTYDITPEHRTPQEPPSGRGGDLSQRGGKGEGTSW